MTIKFTGKEQLHLQSKTMLETPPNIPDIRVFHHFL